MGLDRMWSTRPECLYDFCFVLQGEKRLDGIKYFGSLISVFTKLRGLLYTYSCFCLQRRVGSLLFSNGL